MRNIYKSALLFLLVSTLFCTAIAAQENKTLFIQGAEDPTIYQSFIEENPDVAVHFSGGMLSPDRISQAMVTNDETADIYAVNADNTFKKAVEKGYVAKLSDSLILSENIKEMYSNM